MNFSNEGLLLIFSNDFILARGGFKVRKFCAKVNYNTVKTTHTGIFSISQTLRMANTFILLLKRDYVFVR